MIKIQPLKNDKIEEYGNIIKQKIVIKKVDIDYIEKIMDRHRIKIADKEQFIKKANEFIEEKIEIDIDLLIKGKLEEIIKIYMTYVNEYPELFKDEITSKETNEQKLMNYILRDIFNYDKIISNKETGIAYEILSSLGVKVCPYCNRQYIQTAINGNKKITRADIDHFYPKTIYPMFALSIFNFIPSCGTCNKLKSSKSFTLNSNLYPYEEGVEEFRIFSYEIPDYSIKIERNIDITLHNMQTIADESIRVAEVSHNSHQISEDLDAEFESQTGLRGNDVKFLFAAVGLQLARIIILNELTKTEVYTGEIHLTGVCSWQENIRKDTSYPE